MDHLIRALLAPFASVAAGVIVAVLLGTVLGIRDEAFMKGFALAGALVGIAPYLAPFFVQLARIDQMERNERIRRIEDERNATSKSEIEWANKRSLEEREVRRLLLATEHEARRPICSHCGKKTSPVFLHRKKDGSADGRFRENPLLCDKCFKPYAGVRPLNLPEKKPD